METKFKSTQPINRLKNMKQPIVIEFEGIDGSGKTTALNYVAKLLEAKGLRVAKIREVGTPQIPDCVKLRELILNPESKLSGLAMEAVFLAMAIETQKWKEAHEREYDVILSDRGILSHYAYGYENVEIDEYPCVEAILKTQSNYRGSATFVLWFDIPAELSLERRTMRGVKDDKIEQKGLEYLQKVRDSFKSFSDESNVITIQADQALFDVKGVLKAFIENELAEALRRA